MLQLEGEVGELTGFWSMWFDGAVDVRGCTNGLGRESDLRSL